MSKRKKQAGEWITTSEGRRIFVPATGWMRKVYDGLAGVTPTLPR